jgi:hypothetical protein
VVRSAGKGVGDGFGVDGHGSEAGDGNQRGGDVEGVGGGADGAAVAAEAGLLTVKGTGDEKELGQAGCRAGGGGSGVDGGEEGGVGGAQVVVVPSGGGVDAVLAREAGEVIEGGRGEYARGW